MHATKRIAFAEMAMTLVLCSFSPAHAGEVKILRDNPQIESPKHALVSDSNRLYVLSKEDTYPEHKDTYHTILSYCDLPDCEARGEVIFDRIPVEVGKIHQMTLLPSGSPAFLANGEDDIGGRRQKHTLWVACKDPDCSGYVVSTLDRAQRGPHWTLISGRSQLPLFAATGETTIFSACSDEHCEHVTRAPMPSGENFSGFDFALRSKEGHSVFLSEDIENYRTALFYCDSPKCETPRPQWLDPCVFNVVARHDNAFHGEGCERGTRDVFYVSNVQDMSPRILRANLSAQDLKAVVKKDESYLFYIDAGTEDDADMRVVTCADATCNSITDNRALNKICDACYGAMLVQGPASTAYLVWGGIDAGGMFVRRID